MSAIPEYVGASDLASFLKITPRQLQKLVAQGVLPKSSRGKYPFRECAQEYYGRKAGRELELRPDSDPLRETRQREIQQRIAIRDRTLINFDEALAALETICGLFLAAISGLPAQITREHGERTRIEGICDAVRRRLSKRFAEVMEAVRAGKPVGGAEREDDA
ncbi:hypothetical protein [Mesorhizobium sp.]|uniref:hypothetical protein n=1 Tax=Mesorhizobium sp. TaxID=1871066 RepID=UPI0011F70A40|nr:hypothetical protein [Mesorhizobium sp.]TIN76765.1 MAG: hypothetical protein E5Y09_20975 [Mesorhizobium sp.]